MRAWRADVTNVRWFNHNSFEGKEFPQPFRLRHYPARDYERAMRRILLDRADIERDGTNGHYNSLARNLDRIVINPRQLHFDDGVNELHTKVTFDWSAIYRS